MLGASVQPHFDRWRLVRFGLASTVSAAAYLIVIGVPTAVIPNPWFERMTDVTASNVVFWIVPALLTGALLGSYVVPLAATTCAVGERTLFAGLLSFLSVGRPLCNKVVVLLIGAAGALTYFEPIQPVLGLLSVANARVRALAPRRRASASIPLTRASTLAGMPPATRRYVSAARVLPMTGDEPIENGVVALEDTRIVGVGPLAEFQDELAGAPVEHFRDGTLLPGLIDAHAHLTLPSNRQSYERMAQDSDELMALISIRNLHRHLVSGVTTIRDNGCRNRVTFAVREALRRGYFSGPRLLLAGRPLTHRLGHFWWCNGEADGEAEIRAAVRQLVAEGADHIKIMASGGGTAGTSPYHASYTSEELRVAVETAHGLDRLTTAHCRARQSMHFAVDAGLDCIEHAEFLVPSGHDRAAKGGMEYDARLTERMLQAGTFVSFTFQAGGYASLLELRQAPGTRGPERDELEAYFDAKRALFGQLLRDGMLPRLVISTDAGPGDTEFGHLEHGVQLAVESGMPCGQALAAVTRIAAEACGVGDMVGTLEPGKEADLLVVGGNPLENIAALTRVQAVFVAGERVAESGVAAPRANFSAA